MNEPVVLLLALTVAFVLVGIRIRRIAADAERAPGVRRLDGQLATASFLVAAMTFMAGVILLLVKPSPMASVFVTIGVLTVGFCATVAQYVVRGKRYLRRMGS